MFVGFHCGLSNNSVKCDDDHQNYTEIAKRCAWCIYMNWDAPPTSNSGKWRFIGIPYLECNDPVGDCYWGVGILIFKHLNMHCWYTNIFVNICIYQLIQCGLLIPPVGGHLTFERVNLTIPKRSQKITWYVSVVVKPPLSCSHIPQTSSFKLFQTATQILRAAAERARSLGDLFGFHGKRRKDPQRRRGTPRLVKFPFLRGDQTKQVYGNFGGICLMIVHCSGWCHIMTPVPTLKLTVRRKN